MICQPLETLLGPHIRDIRNVAGSVSNLLGMRFDDTLSVANLQACRISNSYRGDSGAPFSAYLRMYLRKATVAACIKELEVNQSHVGLQGIHMDQLAGSRYQRSSFNGDTWRTACNRLGKKERIALGLLY